VKHLRKKVAHNTLNRVFGESDSQSLETRIHVDNDARCAARWLASEHATDPGWRDFCCIFVASGVGAGLVLDGAVYYGTNDRAGELGHVALHQEDHMRIDGVQLQPRLCSCGQEAFHFETLAGVGGLGQIAWAIDAGKLAGVRRKVGYPTLHQLGSPTSDDIREGIAAYDAAGFDVLMAFHKGLHQKAPYKPYLSNVFAAYSKVFGIGIGALINVLDVNRVAVCGAVPEQLKNKAALKALLAHLPPEATVGGHAVVFEWGDMPDWGWRGAALLSRDPDYLARR
jgi:predicted NBD/HSP70 family sugar kinase